jgi:uncharacterized LabA/DUF88 family protein
MTLHLGTVRPGSTLYIPFDTFAGSTGASVTMSGLAVGDIKIYKNGGTTERGSTNGFTLLDSDGIDFDAVTGLHGFSIDLADNSTAGFYVAGASYWVVVSTITVDSQTVSFVAATFDIGYPQALLNTHIATLSSQTSFTLSSGPAEDDALNGCVALIHDVASAVQLGHTFVQDYTGTSKTVTLAAGATFTVASGDNISFMVPSLQPTTWGRTLDVSSGGEAGVDWNNIGSPTTTQNLSGTTVKTATDVETKIGTPSNLGGGATLAANLSDIEAQTDDIGAAGAGLTAIPWNANWDAEVQSEVQDALEVNNLDHLVKAAVDTDFATTVQANSVIGHLADNGAGFDRTTDSLEALRDNAGTAGAGLSAVPWNANWDAEVQSEVQDAIEVNNLDHLVKAAVDTDFATTVQANSVIGHLADNGAGFDRTTDSLEALRDRGDAAWTTGTSLDAAGVRAAVGLAAANLDTQLTAIDDYLDTEVAAIKAKTDQLTFTAGSRVDADAKAISGSTESADRLEQSTEAIVTGVVGAGSTTTSIVTSSLSPAASVADQFKGKIISFAHDTSTAALRGQSSDITASTSGGILTVTAMTTAASSGDVFCIT